jgi:hypothetical protein
VNALSGWSDASPGGCVVGAVAAAAAPGACSSVWRGQPALTNSHTATSALSKNMIFDTAAIVPPAHSQT